MLENYKQDGYLHIHSLKQRDMSVEDYIVEFDNLMLKGELKELEEHIIAQFLGGLKYEISNVVNL